MIFWSTALSSFILMNAQNLAPALIESIKAAGLVLVADLSDAPQTSNNALSQSSRGATAHAAHTASVDPSSSGTMLDSSASLASTKTGPSMVHENSDNVLESGVPVASSMDISCILSRVDGVLGGNGILRFFDEVDI